MWSNNVTELLEPVFQPITDRQGRVYVYEALLRFRGDSKASPIGFIQRWERSGFIPVIDGAMLDRIGVALKACGWRPRLAVNVSIATIAQDAERYLTALKALGPLSARLVVELTETRPITNPSLVLRFVAACKASGFYVALDDCSPGHPYGVPAFISNIRPDLVKIDGGFLAACHRTGRVAELRAIVDTAHSFNARVIAEQISSPELREFALFIGVNYLQGFAIGEPAPLPAASRRVDRSRRAV